MLTEAGLKALETKAHNEGSILLTAAVGEIRRLQAELAQERGRREELEREAQDLRLKAGVARLIGPNVPPSAL